MFARAGAAGDVQTVLDDVVPGVPHRLQQAAVAGGPGQLAEADQVREHLVGLAVGRLVHALARSQRRRDGRAPWLIPRLHDVPGEFEVPGITREPVEQDDRLEDAGRGHADVGSGREKTLLARKRGDQQVGHLAAAVERGAVSGVLIIRQQTDQVVLVRPDVPVGSLVETEPLFRDIGPEVAVGLLASDEVGRHAVELGLQSGVAGVRPGQGCRVQPLADVLADPGMAAGTLAIAGKQRLGIDCQQPVLLVGLDPRPQPAADVDLRGREHSAASGRPA